MDQTIGIAWVQTEIRGTKPNDSSTETSALPKTKFLIRPEVRTRPPIRGAQASSKVPESHYVRRRYPPHALALNGYKCCQLEMGLHWGIPKLRLGVSLQ